MRTPNRVVIFISKADRDEANQLLEANGFGPDNFNTEMEDGSFMFSAALQDWEKARIESLLSGLSTTSKLYPNDGTNPKEQILDAVSKEGKVIKPSTAALDG